MANGHRISVNGHRFASIGHTSSPNGHTFQKFGHRISANGHTFIKSGHRSNIFETFTEKSRSTCIGSDGNGLILHKKRVKVRRKLINLVWTPVIRPFQSNIRCLKRRKQVLDSRMATDLLNCRCLSRCMLVNSKVSEKQSLSHQKK